MSTAKTDHDLDRWRKYPIKENMSKYDEMMMQAKCKAEQMDLFVDERSLFEKLCSIEYLKEGFKAAHRVMDSISKYISSKLKLVVNQEKSKVALSKNVKFLGLTIIAGTIAISAVSMNRAMTKVKELKPRGTYLSLEQSINKVNQWYLGWAQYYSMTQYPAQLKKIEAHVRRRLRSRIVGQQKKRRHLFNKLIKRGLKRSYAANAVYNNDGRFQANSL